MGKASRKLKRRQLKKTTTPLKKALLKKAKAHRNQQLVKNETLKQILKIRETLKQYKELGIPLPMSLKAKMKELGIDEEGRLL